MARQAVGLERMALALGLDSGAADDAEQAGLIAVWQSGANSEADCEAIAKRAARSYLIDEHRQLFGRTNKRRRSELPEDVASPQAARELTIDLDDMTAALELLPGPDRKTLHTILESYLDGGANSVRCAELLGISERAWGERRRRFAKRIKPASRRQLAQHSTIGLRIGLVVRDAMRELRGLSVGAMVADSRTMLGAEDSSPVIPFCLAPARAELQAGFRRPSARERYYVRYRQARISRAAEQARTGRRKPRYDETTVLDIRAAIEPDYRQL